MIACVASRVGENSATTSAYVQCRTYVGEEGSEIDSKASFAASNFSNDTAKERSDNELASGGSASRIQSGGFLNRWPCRCEVSALTDIIHIKRKRTFAKFMVKDMFLLLGRGQKSHEMS